MIKSYSTLIKTFKNPNTIPSYLTASASLYLSEGSHQFYFEITDRTLDETYIFNFNADWCPKSEQEWLSARILTSLSSAIHQSSNNQKSHIARHFNAFTKSLN